MVKNAIEQHIEHVLSLSLVTVDTIRKAGLKVVVDGVNSSGGIAIPTLFSFGCKNHIGPEAFFLQFLAQLRCL